MYVLDTNVVSELRRPAKADRHVVQWAAGVEVAEMFISAMTIMELELGALRMARRDRRQGQMLHAWIDDQILPQFDGRILIYDVSVARRCARLHVPDQMSERDAIIAATALVHNMTIVTRNTTDFTRSGVALLNPWD